MSNDFYNHATYPSPNSAGSSAAMRAELELIKAGFDKMPTLTGNGYKLVGINPAGTALVADADLMNVDFSTSNTASGAVGRLTWNDTDGTLDLGLKGGNVTLQIGQEEVIRVLNNTGSAMVEMQAVYITGSSGQRVTVALADADLEAASSKTLGILTEDIANNAEGFVTFGGLVRNVNTSAFTEGAVLWLSSTAGGLTTTRPTAPINSVMIGYCVRSHATQGSIYVQVQNGYELDELHDVNITTVAAYNMLRRNSANTVWENIAGPSGAIVGTTDTQTLTNKTISGGTVNGAAVTGLSSPTNSGDAATKGYTDTGLALKLNLSGGTMSGAIAMGTSKITGLGNPTSDQDAATKVYVDNAVQGLDAKASVRAATTANITLSGTQTIDDIALSAGERVLVKDQSTAANNGIYLVAAGSWTRTTDADAWTELVSAFVFVEAGTTNGNNGYTCTVAAGGTLGSTAITWVQFSGAGQITAGAGLTKSGNTLNVGTASSARIVVNADNIDLATSGVTAGNYALVTVDSYGRVTAGSLPTTIAGFGITNAYTKTEVDTALALKLNLTGGTLSGNLAMGGNKVTGLGAPTTDNDAVRLIYVTTLFGSTSSAAASAAAALVSENAAAASQSAAATSEGNALTYKNAAATSATNAATSETNAASSATAAAASYDAFDDRYLGAKSTAPAVDNDGNALITGALYFDTTLNSMRVYDGSVWMSAGSSVNGTSRRYKYVATAAQTTFTGTDANGATLAYDPGYLDVYLNGSRLDASDYTATSGSSIVLAVAASANDELNIVCFGTFAVATHVLKSGDTMTGQLTLPSVVVSGGTANGVGYLNGSKVLTTGSALVFDGTNLGVGTSSPAKQLDLAANNTGITTGDPLNTLRFTDTDTTSAAGQPMGRIEWFSADTDTAGVKAYIQAQSVDGSPDGDIVFATNHVSGGGTTEKMRIQYDGNVGIGTSSPSQKLTIADGNILLTSSSSTDQFVDIGTSATNSYSYVKGAGKNASATTRGWRVGYSPTTDTLNIVAATSIDATTGLRIDSSGNLGLGVTPSAWASTFKAAQLGTTATVSGRTSQEAAYLSSNWLYDGADKYIANGFSTIYRQASGAHAWLTAPSGTAGNAISFTQAMTLDASGNLGIGATSPTFGSGSGIEIERAGSNATLRLQRTTSNTSTLELRADSLSAYLETRESVPLIFGINAVEKMRLDSSGNLLVGTTGMVSGYDLKMAISADSGTNKWGVGPRVAVPGAFYVAANTTYGVYLSSTTATSWASASDERVKTDLQPIENAAEKVCSLRAVTGRYTADDSGVRKAFLIAQDVLAVLPEAVDTTNPEKYGLAYTDTIPLLVAAIKEQQAIITQLQADVAALKGN